VAKTLRSDTTASVPARYGGGRVEDTKKVKKYWHFMINQFNLNKVGPNGFSTGHSREVRRSWHKNELVSV
jgi:hypothetical protein